MGGWGWLTMAIITMLAALARNRVTLAFIGFSLITSFIPQSHELRYSLFLHIVGAFAAVFTYRKLENRRIIQFLLFIVFSNSIFVGITVSPKLNFRTPVQYTHEEAKIFWKSPQKSSESVICSLPLAIYYSGPTFNQFKVRGCH